MKKAGKQTTKRMAKRCGHAMTPGQHRQLVLPVHMACSMLAMGAGGVVHRHTIAVALNIGALLSTQLKNALHYLPDFLAAQAAIIAADERFTRTEKWGFTSAEISAVRHAALVYDGLIRRANSATIEAVIHTVYAVNASVPDGLGSVDHPVEYTAEYMRLRLAALEQIKEVA